MKKKYKFILNIRLTENPLNYNISSDNTYWCVDSGSETPGYIPNPEVKPTSGDDSARATWCQNSWMHLFFLF